MEVTGVKYDVTHCNVNEAFGDVNFGWQDYVTEDRATAARPRSCSCRPIPRRPSDGWDGSLR